MVYAAFAMRPEYDPQPGLVVIELNAGYGADAEQAHATIERILMRRGDRAEIRDAHDGVWPMALGSVAAFWVWSSRSF